MAIRYFHLYLNALFNVRYSIHGDRMRSFGWFITRFCSRSSLARINCLDTCALQSKDAIGVFCICTITSATYDHICGVSLWSSDFIVFFSRSWYVCLVWRGDAARYCRCANTFDSLVCVALLMLFFVHAPNSHKMAGCILLALSLNSVEIAFFT